MSETPTYSADEMAEIQERMENDLTYRMAVQAEQGAVRRAAAAAAEKAAQQEDEDNAADRAESNSRFQKSVQRTTEAPRPGGSASDGASRATGKSPVERKDVNRYLRDILDRKAGAIR